MKSPTRWGFLLSGILAVVALWPFAGYPWATTPPYRQTPMAAPAPVPAPAEGNPIVIDAKFPLTWLIGIGVSIVFAMAGVSFQLNGLATTVAKIETKTDIRDERTNVISQSIIALQGDNRTQQAQIDRASADIGDVRRDVEEMRRKQTWAPK